MGYCSRLCPYPVGPSLPPCSLLVVRSGGNFRLVVSWGDLPYLHCQCPFGSGMGGSPPLSFFTVRFHFLGVCSHLHSCGFSPDLRGPHFTHPVLRWPRISPVDGDPPPHPPLFAFAGGRGGPGVLDFRRFYSSQFPSGSFSLARPFVPGEDSVSCFCLFFSFVYYFMSLFLFSSLIFVQDCCCLAVTCEGICRMGTDGTCCMIFSSFTDTVHMQLSDTGYRSIDVVWLGPVSLVLSSHCLLMARHL